MTKFGLKLVAAMLAGASLAIAGPALAQKKPEAAKADAPKPPKLSKPVQKVLGEVQKLQAAKNDAGALALLDTTDAIPDKTNEDGFWIARLRLNSAQALGDKAMSVKALAVMIDSGMVPEADKVKFVRYIGSVALENKDYITATKRYEELLALEPNNADNIVGLAELYQSQRQTAKAVDTIGKAIAVQKASGAVVPESWYRRALGIAYDAKLTTHVRGASLALLRAYPNPVNWRDAIVILQDSYPRIDEQTQVDFLRLQAATGSLNGERDFIEYADTSLGRGFPGEAQWALNEGIAKKMLNPTKPIVIELMKSVDSKVKADRASLPGLEKEIKGNAKLAVATADAYYGYGDFAKAATLYKMAVGNALADQTLVNLRLGASLARSGDAAGAKAAMQGLTGSTPRDAIAQYWLAWLDGAKG
ncbi:tetratricopeptide repeat protein [Sandarakinorhabdus sp.]|uniref:tetratricopeptide repeat protein n=1 Tax=Sandarakinorhabdus sp. TaxID=1916663 RepID=UPI00286E08BD|nr:tetratricopeptide repeat protein [Sandarakinorhabdus sp.]